MKTVCNHFITLILISILNMHCSLNARISSLPSESSSQPKGSTESDDLPAPPVVPAPDPNLICPTGFVRVASSTESILGYNLCIAKYEMKVNQNDGVPVLDGRGTSFLDVNNYYPISRAEGTPWTRLKYSEVLSECGSLGSNYSLIRNIEWDAIANDIASVSTNWSGGKLISGNSDGVIETGAISNGWSFTNSANLLAAGSDSDGYEGTGNNSMQVGGPGGVEQRRTFYLSNGNVIWDLSGNAREIVDIDGLGGTISYSGISVSGFFDLNGDASEPFSIFLSNLITSNGITFSTNSFRPTNSSWINSSENLGKFYLLSGVISARTVSRGGNYSPGVGPGIFAGDSDADVNYRGSSAGFRCVYKP